MRCAYNKNKEDDWIMWCAPRASWPPIQCEVINDKLIGHYHYENKGDDGLMWHAPRAIQPQN
eukprot:14305402-Ditylum_brightwellii.AAC.1